MKNYVIIGGSSGIGKALVDILSKEGNAVYATYRNNVVESENDKVTYHHLDVMSETLSFDFLPEKIDGFAYCPGSINLLPFHRIKPEAFLADFELQVYGAIKTTQQLLPKLKAGTNASVVYFSTVAVQKGFKFHAQVATSKGAIEGLTRSLAADYAPAIRFNAIAPSLTDTKLAERLLNSDEKRKANAERHPLQRIGTPEDIAQMAAFLLSDQSSWITGQILHIDGGMSSIKM